MHVDWNKREPSKKWVAKAVIELESVVLFISPFQLLKPRLFIASLASLV